MRGSLKTMRLSSFKAKLEPKFLMSLMASKENIGRIVDDQNIYSFYI